MSQTGPINPGASDIGHVHLKVSDLERSLRFYCGVLGFELMQRHGRRCGVRQRRRLPSSHRLREHLGKALADILPRTAPRAFFILRSYIPTGAHWPMLCNASFRLAYVLTARPITASVKRSICTTPTTTASNCIGTPSERSLAAHGGRFAPHVYQTSRPRCFAGYTENECLNASVNALSRSSNCWW